MREIKSNAFNETLSSLLIELRNRVAKLSPENIKSLPVNLVDKYRTFLENEFIFDDNSMVNSVDGYKLNGMIRFLTANNMEYVVGRHSCGIGRYGEDEYGRVDDRDVDEMIIVPDGFDGRNGFAFFEYQILPLYFAARMNYDRKTLNNYLTITRNKGDIIIQGKAISLSGEEKFRLHNLTVFYILWRNKDV